MRSWMKFWWSNSDNRPWAACNLLTCSEMASKCFSQGSTWGFSWNKNICRLVCHEIEFLDWCAPVNRKLIQLLDCKACAVYCLIHSLFQLRETIETVSKSSWYDNKGTQDDHYNDVTMGAMASQITSLTIVYTTVYSGADQRKHQSSAWLAFVRGIHRCPVNSRHKWPVTRKVFPFDDVIMVLSRFSQFYFTPLSELVIRISVLSHSVTDIHPNWEF